MFQSYNKYKKAYDSKYYQYRNYFNNYDGYLVHLNKVYPKISIYFRTIDGTE